LSYRGSDADPLGNRLRSGRVSLRHAGFASGGRYTSPRTQSVK